MATMTEKFKAHIFAVDDDPDMLEVVDLILKKAKFSCCCFADADECLRELKRQTCDLIITDVKMPGKSGIELLAEIRKIAPWLPVLVMTSYADIPMSVRAIKAGAYDFIEKPIDKQTLLSLVKSALKQNGSDCSARGKPLTRTETTILKLILQGKTNKEIAHILARSIRTVEVHRSHIMHKLDVDNVVELVKRATGAALDDLDKQDV